MLCSPPDNVNVLEWDKNRTFLKHIQLLSFLRKMTRYEAPKDTTEIMFCLQIILFLSFLQNPARPFLHEDHCGVVLCLRYLAALGRMFELQDH